MELSALYHPAIFSILSIANLAQACVMLILYWTHPKLRGFFEMGLFHLMVSITLAILFLYMSYKQLHLLKVSSFLILPACLFFILGIMKHLNKKSVLLSYQSILLYSTLFFIITIFQNFIINEVKYNHLNSLIIFFFSYSIASLILIRAFVETKRWSNLIFAVIIMFNGLQHGFYVFLSLVFHSDINFNSGSGAITLYKGVFIAEIFPACFMFLVFEDKFITQKNSTDEAGVAEQSLENFITMTNKKTQPNTIVFLIGFSFRDQTSKKHQLNYIKNALRHFKSSFRSEDFLAKYNNNSIMGVIVSPESKIVKKHVDRAIINLRSSNNETRSEPPKAYIGISEANESKYFYQMLEKAELALQESKQLIAEADKSVIMNSVRL